MSHTDSRGRGRAWFAHGHYGVEGVDFQIRHSSPFIIYDRWGTGGNLGGNKRDRTKAIGEMSAVKVVRWPRFRTCQINADGIDEPRPTQLHGTQISIVRCLLLWSRTKADRLGTCL